MTEELITAEQFAAGKLELPEGGRWHELHEGRTVLMQPPDDAHGNAVLNLSKALANWFAEQSDAEIGYACHEIGLHVERNPDSVFCPAVSYFTGGSQFAEADNVVAASTPSLVVDIASANDRRRDMRRRTLAYVNSGVQVIWVPDPQKKEVQIIARGRHTLALGEHQTIISQEVLPGFELAVRDVFRQPSWWR
jgi:Uma2 family endonuclease